MRNVENNYKLISSFLFCFDWMKKNNSIFFFPHVRSKVNFSAITHPNDWALAKLFLVMLRENKLNVEARLQYTLLFFFMVIKVKI